MSAGDTVRKVAGSVPIFGGLLNSLWGDPIEEDKQDKLKQVEQMYAQHAPVMNQGRMTGLKNQEGLFGNISSMLQQMYGPEAGLDFSSLNNNPFPQQQWKPAPKPPAPAPPPPPPAGGGMPNQGYGSPAVQGPGGVLGYYNQGHAPGSGWRSR